MSVGNKYCQYDTQGNPTEYFGTEIEWEKGRQLKSYGSYSYTYNANGIRTSKTVDGVKHTYILDGTKILRETWGTNTLIPLYDNEDNVCGICYNDDIYYFVKNLQGDVISLVSANNTVVAHYSYDAWGKCTIVSDSTDVSIATVNPYRYRGYYYDVETGLYYLQSRYYDPEVGRFICGDKKFNHINLAGVNLFTYCYNCPYSYVDFDGRLAISSTIGMGALLLFGLIGTFLSASVTTMPEFQYSISSNSVTTDRIFNKTLIGLTADNNTTYYESKKTKSIEKSISESFSKAKVVPKYRSMREKHHVIAKKSLLAMQARIILHNVKIGIDSVENTIFIKTGLHRRLHSHQYFGWTNSVVVSAYRLENGNTKKANVTMALYTIKSFIRALDLIAPF